MEPGERPVVVYLDSIDERLLDELTRMTGCTAPLFPSLGDRGSCTFYQYRLGSFGPRTLAWNGHQRV